MVNDIAHRAEAFESFSAHPYSSAVVPPSVEQAARTGKLDVVQQFLDSGGSPNARTLYQSQLLHVAARHGQLDVLTALLKAPGIDLQGIDYVSAADVLPPLDMSAFLPSRRHNRSSGGITRCHCTMRREACGGLRCTGRASAATSDALRLWWTLAPTQR